MKNVTLSGGRAGIAVFRKKQNQKRSVMANTYTQLFVQIVYAVKGRQNFILPPYRETLQQYTTGVLQNDKHRMLAVFYMPDYVHFLVGLNPDVSISDMVQDVKRATTNFINDQRLTPSHFNWQKGYGAFSYSKSQVRM